MMSSSIFLFSLAHFLYLVILLYAIIGDMSMTCCAIVGVNIYKCYWLELCKVMAWLS